MVRLLNGEIIGNNIQVNAAELEKILCKQNKSRASVARDINVESKVSVNLASGDAVAINTVGTTTAKLKPTPTPAIDAKGYYMLGEVNGNGWTATSPVWMTKVSDGVYQLKVTTEKDKNYFKFYEGSKWVKRQLGCYQQRCLGLREGWLRRCFWYNLLYWRQLGYSTDHGYRRCWYMDCNSRHEQPVLLCRQAYPLYGRRC